MNRKIGRLIALVGAMAVLLATIAPSLAATGGRPDGNGHPNVGAMIVAQPPHFGPTPWCSGVLVGPTTFLTARHCTAVLAEPGAVLLGVTFASAFDPASSTIVPGAAEDTNAPDAGSDLAIISLDGAPAGITPAAVLTDDLASALSSRTGDDDPIFTAVGYGLTSFITQSNGRAFDLQDYGIRRSAPLRLEGIRDGDLLLSSAVYPPPMPGSETPCFGDSGGPVFADGAEMVVAINTATTLACADPFAFTRLDTPAAQAVIERALLPTR